MRPDESAVQITDPGAVKRQLAIVSAEQSESFHTLLLRGLRAVGVEVPDDELIDRRKRRNRSGEPHNGA